jgi:hypothetical protein
MDGRGGWDEWRSRLAWHGVSDLLCAGAPIGARDRNASTSHRASIGPQSWPPIIVPRLWSSLCANVKFRDGKGVKLGVQKHANTLTHLLSGLTVRSICAPCHARATVFQSSRLLRTPFHYSPPTVVDAGRADNVSGGTNAYCNYNSVWTIVIHFELTSHS